MRRVEQLGELGLIRRLRESGGPLGAGIRTGIGDDTAVLDVTRDAVLLATTDLIVEDVHFRRASATFTTSAGRPGRQSLRHRRDGRQSAMGAGRPRTPRSAETKDVDALYAGMRTPRSAWRRHRRWGHLGLAQGWMVSVTLLGEHTGTPRLRSMARPGDAVAVTGSLGRSAAGLARSKATRRRRARRHQPGRPGGDHPRIATSGAGLGGAGSASSQPSTRSWIARTVSPPTWGTSAARPGTRDDHLERLPLSPAVREARASAEIPMSGPREAARL
jgi:hypothetical protein